MGIWEDFKRNQAMRNGNRSEQQFVLPSGNAREAALAGNQAPINSSLFVQPQGNGAILDALGRLIQPGSGIRGQGPGTIGPTTNRALRGMPDANGFLPSDAVDVVEQSYAARAAQDAYNKDDITFDQKTGKPKVKAASKKSGPSLDDMRAIQSAFVRPKSRHQRNLDLLNPTASDFGDDGSFY